MQIFNDHLRSLLYYSLCFLLCVSFLGDFFFRSSNNSPEEVTNIFFLFCVGFFFLTFWPWNLCLKFFFLEVETEHDSFSPVWLGKGHEIAEKNLQFNCTYRRFHPSDFQFVCETIKNRNTLSMLDFSVGSRDETRK